MKIFKRIIILFAIVLVLLFVALSVYVKFNGRDLAQQALKSALNRDVALEKISYQFPLSVKVQNIRISQSQKDGKTYETKGIVARLSPRTFYEGKLVFDSVVFLEPSVVVEMIKTPDDPLAQQDRRYGIIIPPGKTDIPSEDTQSNKKINQDKTITTEVAVKQLTLKQGRFQYTNRSIDKDFSFAMEDVFLKANNLIFPVRPAKSKFNITGRLVKKGNPLSGSSVEGRGWVDVASRDMQANVEIIEADGSVGMAAQAISKNNDMAVKGEVKFQNIFMQTGQENLDDESAVSDMVFNALSSAGVKIGANFSFKTKMDDFRPEQISFTGNVVTK